MKTASPLLRTIAWTLTLVALFAAAWMCIDRGSEWTAPERFSIPLQPKRLVTGERLPRRLPAAQRLSARTVRVEQPKPRHQKSRPANDAITPPQPQATYETRLANLQSSTPTADPQTEFAYPLTAPNVEYSGPDKHAWNSNPNVNHFSQDPRAMSPRHWGQLPAASGEVQEAPGIVPQTDDTNNRPSSRVQNGPGFFQVEGNRQRQAEPFYELRPFDPEPDDALDNLQSPLPTTSVESPRPPRLQSWSDEV